jgi:hypothetical protein
LAEAAEEFAASPLGQTLLSPTEARGRCKPAALAAYALLRERGLDPQLIRFDRNGEHHWIAAVGDVAFDPSARQFKGNENVPVPFVHPLADLQAEWDEQQTIDWGKRWTVVLYGLQDAPAQPWSVASQGLPPRPPTLDEVWPTVEPTGQYNTDGADGSGGHG